MDHSYIEEHQVVDRYLLKQLTGEEAVRFEDHYVHCQQCLDQLEVAEQLQRGFKQAVAVDAARVDVTRRLGVLAWLARRLQSPRAGVVAMVLVAVAVLPASLMILDLRRTGRQLDEAKATVAQLRRPQINTGLFSFSPQRGALLAELDPSHIVRLAADPEWIVLSLELDLIEHDSYRVTLLRGKQPVWQSDGLEPNHLDSLALSLNSTWLTAGDYLARVESAGSIGEAIPIAQFSFRVISSD